MQIALYGSHHELPFWGEGCQPKVMFDPSVSKDWVIKSGWDNEEEQKFSECHLWPILIGLHSTQCNILAHVSVGFYSLDEFEYPKRVWVQITTLPKEEDEQGLPLVVKPFGEGKNVQHLWGGDNGTYSPWGFVKDASEEDRLNPKFWKHFFEKQLRCERDKAIKNADEAVAKAEHLRKLYDVLG